MTDLAEESNSANRDHSVIQVREEGEISDAANQTLSGNETNRDELLASLIEAKLPQKLSEPDAACIFRVPHKLVGDNENAFVPQVVSIGPYHHGGKKFEAMEQIKLLYLQRLLKREPTPDTSLVKFVKEIRSREEFLRSCYDQKIDHLSSGQFVEMMVVDGCFILELIRGMNPFSRDDDVFSMPEMLPIVENDLLLLENQLPWKVLDCLFNLTKESGESSLHVLTSALIAQVMHNLMIRNYSILEITDDEGETWQFRHLLDYARDLLVGSLSRNRDPPRPNRFWEPIPSVTHLEEIGVKFQLASSRTELLGISITFNAKNGVMKIPRMRIGANTECVFRNLIAYERCSMKPHYILSYAMLLNQLIKSTKDLDTLNWKEIVATDLSKEDTVSLFKRLCNDTASIPFVYSQLAHDMYLYNEDRRLMRWLARIKRNYLYNQKSILSLFSNAVVLALILTALQTVYSVLAYYKQ